MNETSMIVIVCSVVVIAVQLVLFYIAKTKMDHSGRDRELLNHVGSLIDKLRQEMMQYLQKGFLDLAEILTHSQRASFDIQDRRLAELSEQLSKRIAELSGQLSGRMDSLRESVNDRLQQVDQRLANNSVEEEKKLEAIRNNIEQRLSSIREENRKQLEDMRATVDEKLQKTLEERISRSFSLVNERLEQVYKGLGEMQVLASGVGDLKKILSNVKTRGILGEVQLGAILEQILPHEQYDENVAVKKDGERVEYAIKLPGDESGTVYLPIDAKFPVAAYSQLLDAYDAGNKADIDAAKALLIKNIKAFAKTIHDKYLEPPLTTDFGIMFLPVEGLYAEVVREGMVETLQREYKIVLAGPTTMAALLNSLQMGFRTLAIQKHSSEVWSVLGAIKTEFDKFEQILMATQQRLNQANSELDKLVGSRTRAIRRKLRSVEKLPEQDSRRLLELDAIAEGDTALDTDTHEEDDTSADTDGNADLYKEDKPVADAAKAL